MTQLPPFSDFDDSVPQNSQPGKLGRNNDVHGLVPQEPRSVRLERVAPKNQPQLIQQAVIWESEILLDPKGIKFTSEDLHDSLKLLIHENKLPVDLFFAEQAYWVVLGAKGKLTVDDDKRPRVVATPKNSPYNDIQLIAGIDYFGQSSWANVQMMVVVQPTETESAGARPVQPWTPNVEPVIPNGALTLLGLMAAFLLFSGNQGLIALGLIGAIGVLVLYLQSNANSNQAKQEYLRKQQRYQQKMSEWENKKEQIRLKQEEGENNRLLRSFKWDDLRMFKEVISRTVLQIVYENMIQQGAVLKDYVDISSDKNIVGESGNKESPFAEFED